MKIEFELERDEVADLLELSLETADALAKRSGPPKGMDMAGVILRSAMCRSVSFQIAAAIAKDCDQRTVARETFSET